MNQRLIDISLRRGRLIERIASQRDRLTLQMQPIGSALHTADRAAVAVRTGSNYLQRHPGQVVAAIALLGIMKPRRVWRWARRGFIAWQTWRGLRAQLTAFSLRSRS